MDGDQDRNEEVRALESEDSLNDIILICDTESGEISDASTNVEELFGYTREEIVGLTLNDLSTTYSPFTSEEFLARAERTRDEGIELVEWLCKDKDGRTFWTEISLKKTVEEGNERLFCTVRELTQRKEIERQLRKRKSEIKDLHRATTRLDGCETEDELYQVAVNLAELILDFKVCSISTVEGDYLVSQALSSQSPGDIHEKMPLESESVSSKTHIHNKSYLIDDLHESSEAKPARDEYRALISIPIGGIGVFQAVSNEVGYFDREDLELAEMLMSHVNSKVKRIRTERELREQKEKIKDLHEFASEIEVYDDEDELYERAVEAAKKILDFDLCVIGVEKDGYLVTGAATIPKDAIQEVPVEEAGIGGVSYIEQRDFLVDDIHDHPKTDPQSEEFTSAISVPIGKVGVIQVVDEEEGAFDENDLEMVKLLASHINEVVKRIRSRKELEESRRELSTLIENLPGMVYQSESYDEMEFVSEASKNLVNHEPEELVNGDISYRGLIHPEDRDTIKKKIEAALKDRRPFDVSYRVVTEDGEQKWFQEWGSGLYTDENVLTGIEGFITDVTDTKQREQLEVLNRVLRHNIRNEINIILGVSEIMDEKIDGEETEFSMRDDIDKIENSARKISKLSRKAGKVQKILDLNKHPRSTVDIVEVLEDELNEFRRRNPKVEVETSLPDEETVYTSGLLSSAFDEILENAVEHNDGTPEIEIWFEEVERHGRDWVEIRIADNGPVIPKNEREVIFKRKETSLQHGSGLGLWITNWIVDQCGGELEFEKRETGSENLEDVEGGNVVVLRLPKP